MEPGNSNHDTIEMLRTARQLILVGMNTLEREHANDMRILWETIRELSEFVNDRKLLSTQTQTMLIGLDLGGHQ